MTGGESGLISCAVGAVTRANSRTLGKERRMHSRMPQCMHACMHNYARQAYLMMPDVPATPQVF